MLYDAPVRNVESSSISSKEIKLKAGSKAFKILFGTIYKDIIKALVRELFTNAWDSHKDNDSLDIPIEIHAPSKYEPYFSIRDYGTGMSNKVINETYSIVFASTKDKSNDQAGFMGMGSKTPLGYADSFSVISYVDGQYEAYQIYLNSEGNPVIDLQARGSTDEKNGVLVQVSVEDKDINHFNDMIKNFVMTTDANVKVDGKKLEKAIDITFKSSNGHYGYKSKVISGTYLKMGCVLYPLAQSLKDPDYEYNHRYNNQNNLNRRLNIILDFPIGSFDVTASRDDIIYNDKTGRLVKDALASYAEEYLDHIEKEISKAPTFIEAKTIYKEKNNHIANFSIYLEKQKILYWRGNELFTNYRSDCFENNFLDNFKKDFVIKNVTRNYRTKGSISRAEITGVKLNHSLDTKSIILFDDGNNKHLNLKVKHILEEFKVLSLVNNIIYIKGKSRNNLNFLLLSYKLGATCVVDISKYDDIKPEPKPKVTKAKKKITFYSNYGGRGHDDIFDDTFYDELYYIEKGVVSNSNLNNIAKFYDLQASDIMIKYKKDIKLIEEYPKIFIDLKAQFDKDIKKLKISSEDIDYLVYLKLCEIDTWNTKQRDQKCSMLFLNFENVDEKRKNFLNTLAVKLKFSDEIHKRKDEVIEKYQNLIKEHDYLSNIITFDRVGPEFRSAIKKLLIKANIEIK